MSVFADLDAELRSQARDHEQYEYWKEQITLHFEGNIMYFELDKPVRKILATFEREQKRRSNHESHFC